MASDNQEDPSTFGVMFAPDHTRCASEMLRVVRDGGRITKRSV